MFCSIQTKMDFGDKNSNLFSDDNKKEKKNVFNDRKIDMFFYKF